MYRRTTASGADVDVEEDDENDDERVGPMGMPTRSDDDAFTRGSVRYSRSLVALASSSDATDATTTTTDVRRFEDDEDGVAIGAMRGNDEYDDDDARRSGVAKGRKGGDASDSARGVVETMANAIATMVATGVCAIFCIVVRYFQYVHTSKTEKCFLRHDAHIQVQWTSHN